VALSCFGTRALFFGQERDTSIVLDSSNVILPLAGVEIAAQSPQLDQRDFSQAMSRKHKHKHPHKSPGAIVGCPDLESGTIQIRDLLNRGKSRPALEAAKELHKSLKSAESEALLIDAYLARVRDLLALGLEIEANALLDLVRSRHPALALRQTELLDLQAAQGNLDEILRPLGDPTLTKDQSGAIEAVLKRRLLDPADLADCEALPADHPLRRGAAQVTRALKAAASRPVTDEEIALPDISSRSPLAPWKLLARAIAAFHRGDDATCEQALAAIEPDSAPGRLAPLMRAMMAGKPAEDLLCRRICDHAEGLRRELAALDAAFKSDHPQRIPERIRRAIKACREERPDLLELLRQRVSVRAMMMNAPASVIHDALGGASRKDASFWRLFARAQEERGPNRVLQAAMGWDRFLNHAHAESWLVAGGAEDAALYRHMAGLFTPFRHYFSDLKRQRAKLLPGLNKSLMDYYRGQPEDVRRAADIPSNGKFDFYMLYPEQLYERSCALDPQEGAFLEWLEWSRTTDAPKFEAVALAWRQALPSQPAPLVELMNEAERRGALKKALGWLEQAERLDALNPDVRRARWRILYFMAMSHLKQKKAHLVAKDLAQMESLAMAREGDRPILLVVLRWLKALLEGDEAQVETTFGEAVRLMGEPHALAAAMGALGRHCGMNREMAVVMSKKKWPPLTKAYVEAFLRVIAVMEECRMSIGLPESERDALIKLIQSGDYQADAARMVRLARSAVKAQDPILAYAAAGVGLALGDGPETAALLLLRGRSLPPALENRRDNCVLAALVQARQRRDMDLCAEALDEWRHLESQWPGALLGGAGIRKDDLRMDPRHLERVLAFERTKKAYPHRPNFREEDCYLADCPCERCLEFRMGKNGRRPGLLDDDVFDEDDDVFDEDDEESEEDMFGPVPKSPKRAPKPKESSRAPGGGAQAGLPDLLPPGLPPEAVLPLIEMMAKHMRPDGSMPPLEELSKREPGIMQKLLKALMESGLDLPDEADDADDEDDVDYMDYADDSDEGFSRVLDEFLPPPRQRTRTMRKRKTRKKK
jgi:hypothetical protein